ncbi:helix-turn-helix domain-containing protein [Streptomyces albidoflavus]|uniref:helix-turn-helix domain-containing protein n=1 Tax=Streptomyces albidoflavus TaxID=1886 RepID=UPI00211CDE07|nr:Scr1 family TA system antitoxin-like transcriptional regulator [Streptomyces albidoflavus]
MARLASNHCPNTELGKRHMPTPRELQPHRSARDLFGAKLRAYRGKQPLGALAAELRMSKSHLSRIELADYMPPPELPEQLDRRFGLDKVFAELYELARHEIHPDKVRRRMELEAQAQVIQEYSPQVVPGLLQTEAYARAQFHVHNPRASEGEIERLVSARMSRQALLVGDSRPDYSVIMDEAVLHRFYGGAQVMREQLLRLMDPCSSPSMCIQVIPFAQGGHALVGGSLSLWTLSKGNQVAYEESITTGTLLEDWESVAGLRRAYDVLSACALSPAQTADLIKRTLEALPHE